MKKLLIAFLVSFCVLKASEGEADDTIKRIKVVGGSDIAMFKDQAYQISKIEGWAHKDGVSDLTITESFTDKDSVLRIVSREEKVFPHLDQRPVREEELRGCLWKVRETITRTQNNHRYIENESGTFTFGGQQLTQFRVKSGAFRIYEGRYSLTVEHLMGIQGDNEVSLRSVVVSQNYQRGGETCKKKSGQPYFNDPSGQGSAGEEPQSETEVNQKFRQLFPKYFS